MDAPKQDDPIKVDLDKGSSKDFEIRTMADDLAQGSNPAAQKADVPKVTYQPPSPPPPASPPVEAPSMPSISMMQDAASAPVPPPSAVPSSVVPSDLMMEDEQPKGGWVKSFLMGFVLVLLLGIIGVGSWWWYTNRLGTAPTPTTTPTVAPTTTPPPVVADLISTDRAINVTLQQSDQQEQFFSQLSSLLSTTAQSLGQSELVKITLIRDGNSLSLSDVASLSGIDMGAYGLEGEYMLVAAASNYTPMMGGVFKLTDPELTKNALLAKEQEFPALANQLYNAYTKNALPQAASQGFLENTYQGVSIRYINFATPDRALDYAIYNDALFVAGSRDMIFLMIDKVKNAPTADVFSEPSVTSAPLPSSSE